MHSSSVIAVSMNKLTVYLMCKTYCT